MEKSEIKQMENHEVLRNSIYELEKIYDRIFSLKMKILDDSDEKKLTSSDQWSSLFDVLQNIPDFITDLVEKSLSEIEDIEYILFYGHLEDRPEEVSKKSEKANQVDSTNICNKIQNAILSLNKIEVTLDALITKIIDGSETAKENEKVIPVINLTINQILTVIPHEISDKEQMILDKIDKLHDCLFQPN